jgi:hypothetical protein
MAPCILDLGIRWRWVVSFMRRPLYPQGKSPCYPLDRRLGGHQSRSWRGGVQIPSPRRESNPRTRIVQPSYPGSSNNSEANLCKSQSSWLCNVLNCSVPSSIVVPNIFPRLFPETCILYSTLKKIVLYNLIFGALKLEKKNRLLSTRFRYTSITSTF